MNLCEVSQVTGEHRLETYHPEGILFLVACNREDLRIVVERHGRDRSRQVHEFAQRFRRDGEQAEVFVGSGVRSDLGCFVDVDDTGRSTEKG